MKRILYSVLAVVFLFASCTEDIDTSSRYVFVDYSVASYLESHDSYSEFLELTKVVPVSNVSETTVYQLLTARGNYTCFAPTNEAIAAFLERMVEEGYAESPSWDAFYNEHKRDSIREVVVKNSVINGGDEEANRIYMNELEKNGTTKTPLRLPNMKERRMSYIIDQGALYLADCLVDDNNRDIRAINGVINQIHDVIAPREITATIFAQEIVEKNEASGYLMFMKAVLACGLRDTLNATRDDVYERLRETGIVADFKNYMQYYPSDMTYDSRYPDAYVPMHRDYGFTFFAEKDDFWMRQGIDPTALDAVAQLQQWIADKQLYPDESRYEVNEDYTSPNNMLHQWLTYHILPMKMMPDQLVFHCNEVGYSYSTPNKYTIPIMEWYPTLGERRLLKLYESNISTGVRLNRFPHRYNGRGESGFESYCDPDKQGLRIMTGDSLANTQDIINACIYPIDDVLAYDEHTKQLLGKDRIRFDGMSLFPESITNNIRRVKNIALNHIYIPPSNIYQYFDNMAILSEDTKFVYFNGHNYSWPLFMQDEMKAIGHYDMVFTLPPVPVVDTYELRYKILSTGVRGIVQVYFGSDLDNLPVSGIPIDLTKNIDYYIDADSNGEKHWQDTGDDDTDAELDHALRNHMVMKAAVHEWAGEGNTRRTSNNIRHIVARQTMYPDVTYYVRLKSVLDKENTEFHLDYFELCPKSIYDNPMDPEDIW